MSTSILDRLASGASEKTSTTVDGDDDRLSPSDGCARVSRACAPALGHHTIPRAPAHNSALIPHGVARSRASPAIPSASAAQTMLSLALLSMFRLRAGG